MAKEKSIKQVNVRLPQTLYEKAQIRAEEESRDLSNLMKFALEIYLKRIEVKKTLETLEITEDLTTP